MLNSYMSPEDASKGLFEVYELFSRGFLTMFWLFHSLWTKTYSCDILMRIRFIFCSFFGVIIFSTLYKG